ncbi:MAG: type II toxin-antitoxin system PemK/MazF family toxin [Candidatus Moeniiplasma glomeromycotorum]|nr:type II toxin-antitoxin system PemK/MazF family toxin [Candidatus Moeniiplasma glomeromycotorum]MCE8162293.1 type II toxin-antitoxin system PemK/MazF family toxin [Candidatus Moeniiplasma glomeromycotorum]MCE8166217.1 type II toxin-antitoxin system PemK/MazF family toxin [Candidatus Moeniiplasma glomeromycotorum]MCE8166699.1 type II toxin-antitoxin system PemK/MazF family toxin [Candidatus Moeniiplasma glomeromycotorum]
MSKKLLLAKQGEIWLTEFPPSKEARKPIRPVLVISGNTQNECDQWIVVVPITTEDTENTEPFEVYIKNTKETGLDYPSKIQFIYPFTIDRERLKEHLGKANREIMKKAKKAWEIAFDIENW